MSKYQITLSDKQALLLERALDAYTRIGAAQMTPVWEIFSSQVAGKQNYHIKSNYDQFIKNSRLFTKENFNNDVGLNIAEWGDDVKVLFDLQKGIQKAIASNVDRGRVRLPVWHHGPFGIGSEEIASIQNEDMSIDIVILDTDKKE